MNTHLILSNLINNHEYVSKVFPFLKPEYFEDKAERSIFTYISKYITEYNALPNESVIEHYASNDNQLTEDDLKNIIDVWNKVLAQNNDGCTLDWLYDVTENWCQERSVYNAINEAISIYTDKTKNKNTIPDVLKDALAVSFNTDIGHDFIEDAAERFEYYHNKEIKYPFDIDMLNKITQGGFSQGTLNVFVAGTNAGKTLFMCHLAASYLNQGFNVLYVTLEIAEEEIAKRIDSNLMNIKISDIHSLDKNKFLSKIERIRSKTIGNLKIKQYPPASANVNHLRALLSELQLKKNFNPDVIFIDYLGICASSRLKPNESSYGYYKSVAEELRGLAIERKVPLITNHQLNRSGQYNTDVDLENISESHGISMTADFMASIIVTPEFMEEKKVMIKQLKSRYVGIDYFNKFMIGMDREKMRLYNLEDETEQEPIETAILKPKLSKSSLNIDFT